MNTEKEFNDYLFKLNELMLKNEKRLMEDPHLPIDTVCELVAKNNKLVAAWRYMNNMKFAVYPPPPKETIIKPPPGLMSATKGEA